MLPEANAQQAKEALERPAPFEDEGEEEPSTWGLAPGDPIVPDLFAWELLGCGRRHESWLAWSVSRWNHVVVKLPRQDSVVPSTRRALEREADIAGALSHPSIVRLLDARVDPADPLPYVVYEYVEGPTLDQALGADGALAPADAVRLGMQIAATLHYLHGKGFVHLDLKPGNLGLRDGRAVLLDFDIALPIGVCRSETRPRGTPSYMAPEQVRCLAADPSMDLWALGAVLYEAVTDEQAFEIGGDREHRDFPQLTRPPSPPRDLVGSIPEGIERVILELLRRDPAMRPATAMGALTLLRENLPPDEEGLWPGWADALMT